jgi:Na+-translocating ferredoxin:NAD+ oxidoreductase RnfC subunit
MTQNKLKIISDAGIVGAGGAGFPTHVKFAGSADTLIANGAECEPLLECDRHLLLNHGEEIISGMIEGMKLIGAKRALLAIKGKHADLVKHLTLLVGPVKDVELFLLPDVYPMGDEQVLVYEATGRLVPPGEIPLAVSCVVSNVMTFYNINRALYGETVTSRNVTVNGLVNNPFTTEVPIGTSFGELIKAAGGYTENEVCLIAGGPMTGFIVTESDVVTKTTGGLLVLRADSHIVLEKQMSMDAIKFQSKSACFQCRDCTRVCPRWQLGSPLQPHLIMRAANYPSKSKEVLEILKTAHYCCECGLCSTIGCQTMRLSPRKMCASLKKEVERPAKFEEVVAVQDIRLEDYQIPSSRILLRYGLSEFDHTDFVVDAVKPQIVSIPMKQHIGIPARPVVKVGETVKKGQLIGAMSHDGLSASVHASIDGTVTYTSKDKVVIGA